MTKYMLLECFTVCGFNDKGKLYFYNYKSTNCIFTMLISHMEPPEMCEIGTKDTFFFWLRKVDERTHTQLLLSVKRLTINLQINLCIVYISGSPNQIGFKLCDSTHQNGPWVRRSKLTFCYS